MFPALDSAGNVYVADGGKLWRIDAATGRATTIGSDPLKGTTSTALLFVEPDSLLVSDAGGSIRRVGLDGHTTIIAGGGFGF